jgi:ferredoxin
VAKLKIAIIGSGASAVGVLSGIEASGVTAEVIVYSSEKYFGFSPLDSYAAADIERFCADVYADIKRRAVDYPPRKTFYGDTVPCYTVNGEERFFKVDMFGGQTNIWGGSVLPLRKEDFASWPISREELEPHYQAIADLTGIAGQRDRISDFIQLDYSNTPPVKQLSGFRFLGDYLNSHAESDDYSFHAGGCPFTVDTGNDSLKRCIYCGECMAGCPRDSIYSSRPMLRKYIEQKAIQFVGKNIRKIDIRDNKPAVWAEDGKEESFDRVFLCAGCVSTTEIVMRSLSIRTGPVLQDNAIYQFPILNMSRHADKDKNEYFGLTNLMLLLEPKKEELPFLQAQLYPSVDYFWRTLVPRWSWNIVRYPLQWLRDRVLWVRVYMDAEDSCRYVVSLDNDHVIFKEEGVPDRRHLTVFMHNLRQALKGSMYFLIPVRPGLAHTSAHLSSTFPYGGDMINVSRDGEIMPHVHIADSTCFPESPVISPTLTIMANARRTAMEAFQG